MSQRWVAHGSHRDSRIGTDRSNMNQILVTGCIADGSYMSRMVVRWITGWVIDRLCVGLKWITNRSRMSLISHTLVTLSNTTLLIISSVFDPSLPCHTSHTKNECNFWPIRSNLLVCLTGLFDASHVGFSHIR